jgi:acetyltransferase-like isoleucine patch superfamily enzyme
VSPAGAKSLLTRLAGPQTPDPRITIGRFSYGTPEVIAYEGDDARVHVGSFVSIAEGVTFTVGGNHRLDWVTTFPFRARLRLERAFEDGHPASKGDILVGNDVWIGRGASILSGVTIGNGAVVAALAVVTKSVPPYAVVAGNPAREVKRRFSVDQIEALQRIAWWDWPIEDILARVSDLNGDSVAAFIDRYDVPKRQVG